MISARVGKMREGYEAPPPLGAEGDVKFLTAQLLGLFNVPLEKIAIAPARNVYERYGVPTRQSLESVEHIIINSECDALEEVDRVHVRTQLAGKDRIFCRFFVAAVAKKGVTVLTCEP